MIISQYPIQVIIGKLQHADTHQVWNIYLIIDFPLLQQINIIGKEIYKSVHVTHVSEYLRKIPVGKYRSKFFSTFVLIISIADTQDNILKSTDNIIFKRREKNLQIKKLFYKLFRTYNTRILQHIRHIIFICRDNIYKIGKIRRIPEKLK